MKLPEPPDSYDRSFEDIRNSLLERADAENRKKGLDIEADEERVILHSPDGTRWKLQVANDGSLTTALV